jgi:hypothetical protein
MEREKRESERERAKSEEGRRPAVRKQGQCDVHPRVLTTAPRRQQERGGGRRGAGHVRVSCSGRHEYEHGTAQRRPSQPGAHAPLAQLPNGRAPGSGANVSSGHPQLLLSALRVSTTSFEI